MEDSTEDLRNQLYEAAQAALPIRAKERELDAEIEELERKLSAVRSELQKLLVSRPHKDAWQRENDLKARLLVAERADQVRLIRAAGNRATALRTVFTPSGVRVDAGSECRVKPESVEDHVNKGLIGPL